MKKQLNRTRMEIRKREQYDMTSSRDSCQ